MLVTGLVAARAQADTDQCLSQHEAAQEHRLHGEQVEAREALRACTQLECPQVVLAECTAWLAEVEENLPSVIFAVTDTSGNDLVDVVISSRGKVLSSLADGRALPINPGVHTLLVEASGYASVGFWLPIRESEKDRIVRVMLLPLISATAPSAAKPSAPMAAPPEQPAEAPLPPTLLAQPVAREAPRRHVLMRAGCGLSGVALAAGAAGVALGVLGKSKLDHLRATCDESQGCSDKAIHNGKVRYIAADAAFGVAAAASIGAVVSLVLGARRGETSPLGVSIHAGPRGAECTYLKRF
jgi:hypothetical protein